MLLIIVNNAFHEVCFGGNTFLLKWLFNEILKLKNKEILLSMLIHTNMRKCTPLMNLCMSSKSNLNDLKLFYSFFLSIKKENIFEEQVLFNDSYSKHSLIYACTKKFMYII